MTILFDLDGTLIDSTEAIVESFEVTFATFGIKSPETSMITSQIGHPLDEMMRTFGVEEKYIWEYVDVYKKHYRSISCQKTVLLPSATQAIQEASKIATLGVVTTKTGRYSKELLEHMGLMHYFEVLIGREDVENPKPHPEPILKALERLPTATGEVWMIGDTCMDMQAANAANIGSIGVTCGYGTRENLQLCTQNICDNALEAIAFIIKK